MGDGKKTCLGFVLLISAFVFGFVAYLIGWNQIDSRSGLIIGISVFLFLGSIAGYTLYRVDSWAWVPLIVSIGYAIVPDIILGPADDFAAILLGALITGLLSWRKENKSKDVEDLPKLD